MHELEEEETGIEETQEAGIEDRARKIRKIEGLQWGEREDKRRPEERASDQEQGWKGCEQESFGGWQASLQAHLGLDEGPAEGAQTAQCEGLRGGEEGNTALLANEEEL